MTPDPAQELIAELVQLRSGPGLSSTRLQSKLGARLAQLCQVAPESADVMIRRKVTETITQACQQLSEHDALAVRAALNIDTDCRYRFLKDRMDCLGRAIDRESRTAVRRVDDAFRLLSEILLTPDGQSRPRSTFSSDDWRVDVLSTTLEIESERLILSERRRIVAITAGLDRLTTLWSTEESSNYEEGFSAEVTFGGTLVPDPARSAEGLWLGQVVLPQPLSAGQSHEYGTRVVQPGPVEPYYIVTPLRRTERIEAVVVFHTTPPPAQVWLVDGEPARFVNGPGPDRQVLTVGADKTVRISFEHVDLGLSYGLRWAPPPG